jgi:hypothetical protein
MAILYVKYKEVTVEVLAEIKAQTRSAEVKAMCRNETMFRFVA